ncbi:MAG: PilN domain-containing protein [Chloroflexi bacterium]|nr:PilN domain-containing protein [Chloroflexota bacterium]
MLDLNIETLDELEAPRRPRSNSRLALWLCVLALGVLIVPLTQVESILQEAAVTLAAESDALSLTMTAPAPVPVEEQSETDRLIELRGQVAVVDGMSATLMAGHLDWPAIMASVHTYDSDRIRLTSFQRDGSRLVLDGEALQESDVLTYIDALQSTGYFDQVNIQSITVNPILPATPNFQATQAGIDPILSATYMPTLFGLSLVLKGAGDGSL